MVLTFVRRMTFPWLTRVHILYFIIGRCRGEQIRGECMLEKWLKKSEPRRKAEWNAAAQLCPCIIFRQPCFGLYCPTPRRARHKRVFAEGSGCFPFSGGSKSATRTSPASPRRTERRRGKERRTDRNSFRIETQYRVSYKSTPEKYSSAEVYDHPKVCLCIFQRSRHALSLFFSRF